MDSSQLTRLIETKDIGRFISDLREFAHNVTSDQQFWPIRQSVCHRETWHNYSDPSTPSYAVDEDTLEDKGLLVSWHELAMTADHWGAIGSRTCRNALGLFLLQDGRFLLAKYDVEELEYMAHGQEHDVSETNQNMVDRVYIDTQAVRQDDTIEEFLKTHVESWKTRDEGN
ncbi:MAG: hypothetical protein CO095_13805 [Armatimonadetes bacterium CG_4_9_14_3_um_filter_58_7]|nr:MAG: hypothetical protein CO095_13805 [Armatimonadetes bacterium CG_4_9_14_3_um_filter_58_7]